MSINKETVEYVAHLSRIDLQQNELEKLSLQLNDILGFIDKLTQLDITQVKATSHILPINTVLREDEIKSSITTDQALQNAPQRAGNYYQVPKVIE